jgi:prefoldin subunit 5
MVTKRTGFISFLAFMALAGAGIYCFVKTKESYDILFQKCTDLRTKITDLETDIDLLYGQIESHRSAVEEAENSDN